MREGGKEKFAKETATSAYFYVLETLNCGEINKNSS